MLRFIVGATIALLSSTAAQADWYRASSKHFVVYSDDSERDVRDYTTQLEQFDQAIRRWHVAPENPRGESARVTVFVLPDQAAVGKLAGRSSVAGFYRPSAGESVAFAPRAGTDGSGDLGARAVLFHEYAHHWMLTNWTDAALPPWFVEGFAELHATAMFRGNKIIFGAVPLYRRYSIGQMNAMPMDRLLKFDVGKLDPIETDALYSHGWALTHYLTFDPVGRKQLAAYIGALNSGKAGNPAKLIGDGRTMDMQLSQYVRRKQLPSAAFDVDTLAIGMIDVRKLSAAEAATVPAMILSKRGVNAGSASKALDLARRVAAPYPADAFAQNELAEAEFDACNVEKKADAGCFTRAEAAADRAIAADPKSVHALTYKGMAQVGALEKAKVTDAARWKAARQWFLTANKVDTEAPQPLIAYYDSFVDAGEPATKNAQAGLLYAYALAPYDSDLRIKATRVYLMQGNVAAARVAISPIAYNIESRTRADYAKKTLAMIDTGDAKAALASMDEKPPAESDD